MIGRPRLRPEQRIIHPTFGFIDVNLCGHHVVIAGEDDRGTSAHELRGTDGQTLEPSQLVVELRSGRWIAVGKIKASDDQGANACFNVATVQIIGVAGQSPLRFDRITSSG